MTAWHELTLSEARQKLLNREISAHALTMACLERIEATEPATQALISLDREGALQTARALDAAGPDPAKALWGIPITAKDVLAAKGMPTTAGSRMLEHFYPAYEASVIEKVRAAGAVLLGKNNMDEFAMGSTTENSAFKATSNPWDTTRIPGGSSGGSAASVAAGQCFASLGTDTGGSIRQPSALCGCVGLKPTYGRVSRYGVVAYASSLDQVGPITRSVEDCALMLSVIAGPDPRDSTCSRRPVDEYMGAVHSRQSLEGLALGVPREFFAPGMDAGVAEACQKALKAATDMGAELVDVRLPYAASHSIAAYYILAMAEASSNLARYDGVRYGHRSPDVENLAELYTLSRTEGFGEEVQRRILLGTYVLSSGYYDAYYKKAAQIRRMVREDYQRVLAACDAVIAPVSPVTAWKKGESGDDPMTTYLKDIFTVSQNIAGLPAIAFPVGLAEGLPVGMQLVGSPYAEADLLSMAQPLFARLGNIGKPGF